MRKGNCYIAVKFLLVIETLLNLINGYDSILANTWDSKLICNALLIFTVPFCIWIYSS